MILTAGHCAVGWQARLSNNIINTIGVSFDQNARVGGDPTNRTRFIAGGISIANPFYLGRGGAMGAASDVGLVVFPKSAVDPTYSNASIERRIESCVSSSRSFFKQFH